VRGSPQPIEREAPVGAIGDLGEALCCGFAGDGTVGEMEASGEDGAGGLGAGNGGRCGLIGGGRGLPGAGVAANRGLGGLNGTNRGTGAAELGGGHGGVDTINWHTVLLH